MLPNSRLVLVIIFVGCLTGAILSFVSFSNHQPKKPFEVEDSKKIGSSSAGEPLEPNHVELLKNLFRNSKNTSQADTILKSNDSTVEVDDEKKWIVVGVVMSDESPKAYLMDRGGPVVEVKVGDFLEEKIRIKEISSRKIVIESKALGDKVLELYGFSGDKIE